MADNTVETNVDIVTDGDPLYRVMDIIGNRIKGISREMAAIVKLADNGAENFDAKLQQSVKALQVQLSQLNSVAKFAGEGGKAGSGPITAINQERALAKATVAASKYAQTLSNAENAAQALEARLNRVAQANARAGSEGGLEPRKRREAREALEQQLALLKRLDAEKAKIDQRLTRTSGRTDLTGEASRVVAARAQLEKALLDPNRRGGFGKEFSNLQDAVSGYSAALDAVRTKRADLLRMERTELQAAKDKGRVSLESEKAYALVAREQRRQEREWAKQERADAEAAAEFDKKQNAENSAALKRDLALHDQRLDKARARRVEEEKLAVAVQRAEAKFLSRNRPERIAAGIATGNGDEMLVAAKERQVAAQLRFNQASERQKTLELQNYEISRLEVAEIERQLALKDRLIERSRTLNFQKERALIPGQVQEQMALGRIEEYRAATAERIKSAHRALLISDEKDQSVLRRNLELEQQRLAAIDRQVAARRREQAANNTGPSHILPAGGFGTVVARTAAYGAAGMGIFAVVGALQQGAAAAIELEDALGKLQAIAGATDGQMVKLSASILQVGQQSRHSLVDLVEGATTLAQAGFSTADIEATLASVDRLATATGSTIAQSSDVLTSTITSFGLAAGDSERAADSYVAALNRSKLTIGDISAAIQTAGATSATANMSFQELVATIGAMGNAGVKGQMASVGLRQFIIDLTDPSNKLSEKLRELGVSFDDIDIKTHGLPAVLENLQAKGFGAAEAFSTLENRSAAFYLAARRQVPTIYTLVDAQNKTGAAAQGAAAATKTLSAEWQQLKNNLTTAAYGLLENTPLEGLIAGLNTAYEKTLQYRKERERLLALGFTSDEASNEANRHVGILGRLAKGQEAYNALLDEVHTKSTNAGDSYAAQAQKVGAVQTAISRLVARQGELKDNSAALATETSSLSRQFAGLALYLDNSTHSFANLLQAAQRYRAEAIAMERDMAAAERSARTAEAGTALKGANAQARVIRANFDTRGQQVLPGVDVQTAMWRAGHNWNNRDMLEQIRAGAAKNLSGDLRDAFMEYLGRLDTMVVNKIGASQAQRRVNVSGEASKPDVQALMRQADQVKGNDQVRALIVTITKLMASTSNSARQEALSSITEQLQLKLTSGGQLAPSKGGAAPTGGAATTRHEMAVDVSNDQVALKNADNRLKASLDSLGSATALATYEDEVAKARLSFEAWEKALKDLTKDQIAAKGMTEPQRADRLQEMADTIRQRKEDLDDKIAEGLIDTLTSAFEVAQNVYDESVRHNLEEQGRLEAQLRGLDLQATSGKVPDYVRTLIEQRIARSQQQGMGIQSHALAGQILTNQSALDKANDRLKESNLNPTKVEEIRLEIDELTKSLVSLRATKAELDASLGTEGLVPTTFSQGLDLAVESIKNAEDYGLSFKELFIKDIGGALLVVKQSFTDFFTTILTGSGSVLDAFGAFARGIMQYMEQMAAKAIATQLFDWLIGMIGSDKKSSIVSDAASAVGGTVRRAGGGKVMNGSPVKDSVHTMLTKDEWVIQKSAADSVGSNFLADLNARGAAAVQDLKGTNVYAPVVPKQEMKVYVVSPEERPSLGPNDVLLILQDDILKDGNTKKLIQHVSQGG